MKQKLPLVGAYPPDRAFWAVDGHIVHNLVELKQALDSMMSETYAYHANRDKNDFAKWVSDVLGEKTLAEKLSKSKTRGGAYKVVHDYLKNYQ